MLPLATYRKYVGILLLMCSFLTEGKSQESGSYMADFLGGQFISCIHQDQQGYLWVGGLSGLYQYDGMTFRNFVHLPQDSTSLSSDYVLTVVEDEKGLLWIGTEKGLNRYDKGTERFEKWGKVAGELFEGKITSLRFDANKQLWVGSEAGLFKLNFSSGELIPFRKGELDENVTINCLFSDKKKNLWIGTETAGLYALSADQNSLLSYRQGDSGLESDAIKYVIETQAGKLFVATGFGVAGFDSEADHFLPLDVPGELGERLSRREVEVIVEDPSGALWLGTFEDGLFKYMPQNQSLTQFVNFSVANVNNAINALLIDRSGMLWIGTYLGGLRAVLYQQKRFSSLLPNESSQKDVYAIYENKAN